MSSEIGRSTSYSSAPRSMSSNVVVFRRTTFSAGTPRLAAYRAPIRSESLLAWLMTTTTLEPDCADADISHVSAIAPARNIVAIIERVIAKVYAISRHWAGPQERKGYFRSVGIDEHCDLVTITAARICLCFGGFSIAPVRPRAGLQLATVAGVDVMYRTGSHQISRFLAMFCLQQRIVRSTIHSSVDTAASPAAKNKRPGYSNWLNPATPWSALRHHEGGACAETA